MRNTHNHMDRVYVSVYWPFTISKVRYIEGHAATQILIDASTHSEKISTLQRVQKGRQHNYTHTL